MLVVVTPTNVRWQTLWEGAMSKVGRDDRWEKRGVPGRSFPGGRDASTGELLEVAIYMGRSVTREGRGEQWSVAHEGMDVIL